TPKTNDVLTATATRSDADGDAVSLTYVWKVNGVKIGRAHVCTPVTIRLSMPSDVCIAGNGNKGDTIKVFVTPNDGTVDGATVDATATAQISTLSLHDALPISTPKTNDVLTATATRSDADGDAVSLTYVWKVNGV